MIATPNLRRYAPSGLCAIEPSAFGLDFAICGGPGEPFTREADGKLAVVHARGPLTYDGFFFASYGAILADVRAAFASDAEAVVLHVHSPGGDVFGAFETARELRRIAKAAGKPLIAFTGTQMCSSAYALSSAADRIIAAPSATVGSIGVIATACEMTRADQAMGVSFAIITSGARKADGNPHVPLSDDARAAMQRSVDALASIFFDLVRDHRGGKVSDPSSLQAATFIGAEALAKGLIDEVADWESFVASVRDGITLLDASATSAPESQAMADKDEERDKDEARKALVAASEDKDEKKASRAKRALKAYDESDDKEAADDKDPPKDKDDDKDKAAAAGASVSAIASLESALRAEREERKALAARLDAADRTAFLATRPDLSPELLKSLEGMPLAQIKGIVNAIPKSGFKSQVPTTETPPTRGGKPATVGASAESDDPELDAIFGIGNDKLKPGSTYDAKTNVQSFGFVKAQ